MYFPTKYLRSYHQNHLKTPFLRPFNAKPVIPELSVSHINGATTVKLYSYIGIVKYLVVCQNFSTMGRLGGTGPLNVNLGPPIISETTGARNLKLKTQLDMVKYSLRVQKFFCYVTSRGCRAP